MIDFKNSLSNVSSFLSDPLTISFHGHTLYWAREIGLHDQKNLKKIVDLSITKLLVSQAPHLLKFYNKSMIEKIFNRVRNEQTGRRASWQTMQNHNKDSFLIPCQRKLGRHESLILVYYVPALNHQLSQNTNVLSFKIMINIFQFWEN